MLMYSLQCRDQGLQWFPALDWLQTTPDQQFSHRDYAPAEITDVRGSRFPSLMSSPSDAPDPMALFAKKFGGNWTLEKLLTPEEQALVSNTTY
jgi:hypothetical protein